MSLYKINIIFSKELFCLSADHFRYFENGLFRNDVIQGDGFEIITADDGGTLLKMTVFLWAVFFQLSFSFWPTLILKGVKQDFKNVEFPKNQKIGLVSDEWSVLLMGRCTSN